MELKHQYEKSAGEVNRLIIIAMQKGNNVLCYRLIEINSFWA